MLALRRLAAIASLGLVAFAAQGCLSPTLPLPPPEEPDVVQQETGGNWLVAGACADHALVSIFNRNTGAGVITTCTHGTYAKTLQGQKCDDCFVSQETEDGEQSSETEFLLQKTAGGTPSGGVCK